MSNQEIKEDEKKRENAVSWSIIATVIISMLVGSMITLFIYKLFDISPESFTVADLMSFIFGIALSAASTVLAIVAISLGKSSEKIMVERSDESIRLQNDVFLKTTDALQRIESSTGVTEKRIEDIISGRAGAISEKIAGQIIDDQASFSKNRKGLEQEIRQSLLHEFNQANADPEAEKRLRIRRLVVCLISNLT